MGRTRTLLILTVGLLIGSLLSPIGAFSAGSRPGMWCMSDTASASLVSF